MKKILILILLCSFLYSCCHAESFSIIGGSDGPTAIFIAGKSSDTPEEPGWRSIPQMEAKAIMDSGESYILLDVREQDEYDFGHIAGAQLMPYEQAETLAPAMLPDKDALILVYCRSGRRSKIAAETLAAMGYTNVMEFGGIIDWAYGTVKE